MKKNLFLRIIVLLFLTTGAVQADAQTMAEPIAICNPLNLNYRFQLQKPSRREAADPVLILFKNKYYLFASKSGGYWSSDNLISWNFITTKDLPLEDYAPAAVIVGDSVYFMGLDKRIYSSADPSTGNWLIAKDAFPINAGDPDLFLDDDGRLYLYFGLSNSKPTSGVELDRKTLNPIGKPTELFNTNSADFGWERPGDYNTLKRRPYLEGSWMTKHNGKYYLQYSVPGTEFKSYADGLYIADSPLGPFNIADNNPFSYKPEGFINGAGHSSTFRDKYGNYWHISTMTISVKHPFERRLGLFPAFFDKDGMFYTYTGFGDFPHTVPQKLMKGPEDYQPSGMLLSYNKPIEVSSSLPDHPKENATAENIRKYWSAQTGDKGEWIMIDLQRSCSVNAIQINYAEEGTQLLGRSDVICYQYLLEYSNDKKTWEPIADKTLNKTDVPHDYLQLEAPVSTRYIRLTNYHVPDGKFAVSGLRVFGKGKGKAPDRVSTFIVKRDSTDRRDVKLSWQKSPHAIGYNIRFGTQPNKLYENYQVFDSDTLSIHSLNRLKPYYFAIDAFNENGITKGEKLIKK